MIIDGNRHTRGYSWGGTKWTIPSQSVGRPTLGNVSQDCGRFRKGLENEDLKNISTILISMVEYIYIYTYVYIYLCIYIWDKCIIIKYIYIYCTYVLWIIIDNYTYHHCLLNYHWTIIDVWLYPVVVLSSCPGAHVHQWWISQ